MTPREWAEQAYGSSMTKATSDARIDVIEDYFRAALRERDARWRVVAKRIEWAAGGTRGIPVEDGGLGGVCPDCYGTNPIYSVAMYHDRVGHQSECPLRALLEEAGK